MFVIYISYISVGLVSCLGLMTVYRKRIVSPTKPWLTCLIDAALAIPYLLRIGPFGRPNDINEAIRLAIKVTGLKDFGEDSAEFVER